MSASVRYLEEKTAVRSLRQTPQTDSYLTAEKNKLPYQGRQKSKME